MIKFSISELQDNLLSDNIDALVDCISFQLKLPLTIDIARLL